MKTLQIGAEQIPYTLERQDRATLAITVTPDQQVLVKAPLHAEEAAIEARVRRRAAWILRQIRYFDQFQPRTPPRRYVPGETHLYLGRRYRLRVRDAEWEHVKLEGGYLCVYTFPRCPAARIRRLVEEWYLEHAQSRFAERLTACLAMSAFQGLERPELRVARLKTRWGSMGRSGRLTLNVDLVRAPRECIDYVIVHELCHLLHPDHSRTFYRLLSTAMPDWRTRKQRLETCLS